MQKINVINKFKWLKLAKTNEYTILDVRTPLEFNIKNIENSLNIDFHSIDFEEKISNLDKTKKYLIYCRSGQRSFVTLELMKNLGFIEVYDLEGGIINL